MTQYTELDSKISELERNNPNRTEIPTSSTSEYAKLPQQTGSGAAFVAPETSDLKFKQSVFLEWLLIDGAHREPRTQAELARLLNVNTRALMRWEESPEFASQLKDHLRAKYIYELPEIFSALIRRAKNGDVQAIQLCLQLLGMTPGPELKVEERGMTLEEAFRINAESLEPPSSLIAETEDDCSAAAALKIEPHFP